MIPGVSTESSEWNLKVRESQHVQVDLNSVIFTNSSNWDLSNNFMFEEDFHVKIKVCQLLGLCEFQFSERRGLKRLKGFSNDEL